MKTELEHLPSGKLTSHKFILYKFLYTSRHNFTVAVYLDEQGGDHMIICQCFNIS